MNLYDVFLESVHWQPDQPAILGPKPADRLSYAQLNAAMAAASERLAAAGVRPGQCIGLHCPSGTNYILWTYAAWRTGACVVPIPTELTPAEKLEICREIAIDFVLSEPRGLAFAEPFRRGDVIPLSPDMTAMAMRSPRQPPAGFHAINSAFVRFTSGTTGSAKGVVLSHESIHERILAANDALRIGPRDRVVWLLSMSYHFAVSIVGYLSLGATIILLPNHLGDTIVEATSRHQATLIYGSPVQYQWMTTCARAMPLPSLRLAVSTTTPLDRTTGENFRRTICLPLTQALGIIEIGLPFINVDFASDRCDAVGRLLPAYGLRLDDAGLGPRLKEIVLSGKGFLDAYYEPWRTRDQIMPDGWFRTGDVGEVDGDGCLFLRGRTKDLIDVLGMKFFPQEVERVLLAHPGVAAASVFACRDDRFGETPLARVVAKKGNGMPSEQELLAFCRARLADFKIPRQIQFVDELPRTASGKVLHRPLGR
jgi:long-chain acyl-CoA synthetase